MGDGFVVCMVKGVIVYGYMYGEVVVCVFVKLKVLFVF